MAGNLVDVVGDGLGQGLRCPLRLFDPWGKLRVPDEGVATKDLVLLLSEIGDDLTLGPVEDTLLGLNKEPLMMD